MLEDWGTYNNFSRFILVIVFMAFIFILIFDTYLVIFNVKTIYQFQNASVVAVDNVVRLSLIYGDGKTRIFEGETINGGLTLANALVSISEVGGINIDFQDKDGVYIVQSIDNLQNFESHYWELSLPKLNWSKKLEEVDIRQALFVGGTNAVLTYK